MTAKPDKTAPLFWLLFAGGGMASAMLLPVMVFVTASIPDINCSGSVN